MKTTMQNVEAIWTEASKEQREELLTTLGFNTSWAVADSISEMIQRGGGMVVRDLLKLYKEKFE